MVASFCCGVLGWLVGLSWPAATLQPLKLD